jgi:hypothetical protein
VQNPETSDDGNPGRHASAASYGGRRAMHALVFDGGWSFRDSYPVPKPPLRLTPPIAPLACQATLRRSPPGCITRKRRCSVRDDRCPITVWNEGGGCLTSVGAVARLEFVPTTGVCHKVHDVCTP